MPGKVVSGLSCEGHTKKERARKYKGSAYEEERAICAKALRQRESTGLTSCREGMRRGREAGKSRETRG